LLNPQQPDSFAFYQRRRAAKKYGKTSAAHAVGGAADGGVDGAAEGKVDL
jgi:hypothetical protein